MKTDIRYESNPFLENMSIPIKGKQVKLSPMGKNENIIVNQRTGEASGTHIVTYKKVDTEQFVKLFTSNIALTFNLTSAGIKALNVVVWSVQNSALEKDQLYLDSITRDKFILAHNEDGTKNLKLGTSVFMKGLAELCKNKIIAKSLRKGIYFLNPNFIFNGSRLAFTTLIEKKTEDKNDLSKIKKQPQNELL